MIEIFSLKTLKNIIKPLSVPSSGWRERGEEDSLPDIKMQEVEDGVLRADGELADSVGQHVLLLGLANVLGEVKVASLA